MSSSSPNCFDSSLYFDESQCVESSVFLVEIFQSSGVQLFRRLGLIVVMILGFVANGWAAADEEGFTEDANAAIERAVKEDKELILLFTGSDWCPPCKKLEAEGPFGKGLPVRSLQALRVSQV